MSRIDFTVRSSWRFRSPPAAAVMAAVGLAGVVGPQGVVATAVAADPVGAPVDAKPERKIGYTDTPMQPNGKWHIHDGARPFPTVVTPGKKPGDAPSDAIVLMGSAKDLDKWQHADGSPAKWGWKGGALETVKGTGPLRTKDSFKDFQLHIEWASPKKVEGEDQGRGNSGVFLLGKFEIQVLDSFENKTYPDGQASALYGQFPPLCNASRKPGEWQAYDIVFTAPRFEAGKLKTPAAVTVIHNGVVTQNATAFWGPTTHKKILPYGPDQTEGPIALQDHGNPVRYRNIWIRAIKESD